MVFNSVLFLLFFAVVYFAVRIFQGRAREVFVMAATLIFYSAWSMESEGWWGLRWTAHFLFIVLVNYGLVSWMLDRPEFKKPILTTILVLDILNLAVFKYFHFFTDAISVLIPLPAFIQGIDLFLPLAISFYTFQLVAFAVDAYRGQLPRRPDFHEYLVFTLFFPILIAGPILRARDFFSQMHEPVLDKRGMYDGLWLFAGGLFKKVLLADPLSVLISPVFREPQVYSGEMIFFACIAYALQVFGDFSGYTDMARGTARLMGYRLPENFRAPFLASSASDLWSRWHITLTSWLRDYIYIPLGGNRKGNVRTYLNLILTFTFGGFWHGADWTYVTWGFYWGALLAFERFLDKRYSISLFPQGKLRPLSVVIMFVLFAFGATMFRAYPVKTSEVSHSGTEIMLLTMKGIFTQYGSGMKDFFVSRGGDAGLLSATFGGSVFNFETIKNLESLVFTSFFFLLVQFYQDKPGRLERLRKYDAWLLWIVWTLLFGLLLPSMAISAHQFIYAVF